jgi:hypothetical protein
MTKTTSGTKDSTDVTSAVSPQGDQATPTDGLVAPRKPVTPPIKLQDPRVPPWRDLIAAERRRLRETNHSELGQAFARRLLEGLAAKTGSDSAAPTTKAPQAQPSDTSAAGLAEAGQSRSLSDVLRNWTSVKPTNHTYRYTKAPDLTNDEMGYGERVDEELWFNEGGTIVSRWRSSQRTKSGRQVLFESNVRPDTSVVTSDTGGKKGRKF